MAKANSESGPSIVTKPDRIREGDGPGTAPDGRLGPATVTSPQYDHKERMAQFDRLSSHNFRVVPRIEHEFQTRWIEDLAQTVRVPVTKRRASHVASSIRGTAVNPDSGQPVPFKYAHCPELPFTTFDNPWISDGFTPKEVTRMLFMMPAFGVSFILQPMTDDEVNRYWEQKQSPQVLEAQNRVLDSGFVGETLQMQQNLLEGLPTQNVPPVIPIPSTVPQINPQGAYAQGGQARAYDLPPMPV